MVRLAADSFQVEPGSSVSVAVEVQNVGDERDHFELAVEGLEHHWTAVPVPSFSVEAGETRVERFFLKPPRDMESSAGNYPFVVRVRSLETGDAQTTQANLAISAYFHLSVDVNPRKAMVTPLKRSAAATVTIMNLGNVEQTVQLFANDVDDAFAYEFESDTVTLAPGQQKTVEMAATSTKSGAFSPARLHVLTVSCRNVDNPAYAATVQAHLEQRPLLAPGALAALGVLLLLGLFWFLTIPKPPQLLSLTLDRPSITLGETVNVVWDSQGATSVTLMVGEEEIPGLPAKGNYALTPTEAGDLEVRVVAVNNDLKSEGVERSLKVVAPEVAPDPEIKKLATEKQRIPVGQDFILEYEVSPSVVSLYLEPHGVLSVDANSITLPGVSEPGSRTYILRAKNADGKEVTEELTLRFEQVVAAKIVRFEASPLEVLADERVSLLWQLSNAVSATLEYGDQKIDIDPVGSRRDFVISTDTTFTITAYDVDGLTAKRSVTVKVKQPPVDPPVDDGDATTGGAAEPPRTSTTTTGN